MILKPQKPDLKCPPLRSGQYLAEKLFLFCVCRGLRENEPSQALRTSSPEGRAKTVKGTLLASPFERLPQVGGRCRAATKRGQGVTEGDGEGAPAPLRGAAAAAAEGPSNRRSAKNAFSEATSIFPLRPLLWDYQGRAALDSWVQRVEIAGTFLVLFWCQKRTNSARLQRIEIAVPLPR